MCTHVLMVTLNCLSQPLILPYKVDSAYDEFNMEDATAESRNNAIYEMLVGYLQNSQDKPEFNTPFDAAEVETLFNTSIWGHRELVLTVLLTRLVYPKYKATVDLYEHHPRSVYEKPIRTALREFGIPHKKSGPLNVAKNIKRLNLDWATGKNEENVAVNAVKITEKIESVSPEELRKFAAAYISRYKHEASRVKDLEVKLPPQENPVFIAKLCGDLIDNAPDGGATAQFIVGLLMEINNMARNSDVKVSGYTDSVSATNTTSKKPGDIIELINSSDNEIVYEVTTKAFNDDRLIESHEAVMAYENDIADVFVICRAADIPEALEMTPTAFLMATTQYKELSYYFVNVYQYIQAALLFTTTKARRTFYDSLGEYINDINRSEKVKVYYREWHENRN